MQPTTPGCNALVVNWRSRTRQMEDLVDLQQHPLRDIMADHLKVVLTDQVSHIALAAGEEVVQANNLEQPDE